MHYTAHNLIIHPNPATDPDIIVTVTPAEASWAFIHFQARRLAPGAAWSWATGEHELALVLLGGQMHVASNRGNWEKIGARANVFGGKPHALYLPRHTTFSVTAVTACEFAVAWVPADADYPPHLVTPDAVSTEIRGSDNATRQINTIIPPGFACQRLVVAETYTPSGNWSSYPPHKHDCHRTDAAGNLIEADLEETYFYKFDRPEGFAYQRIYTDAESPLHRAGLPIDALLLVHNHDLVLVPEGYHPVVNAPGYTCYYLCVLAGSAQSLANQSDPRYAWVGGRREA